MNDEDKAIKKTIAPVGKKIKLEEYPTSWKRSEKFQLNGLRLSLQNSDTIMKRSLEQMKILQEQLWAENSRSLLVIIQGMDAAGKDSIVEHVMSGVNPQGCEVTGFKPPSVKDLDHDFMWRYHTKMPERGRMGIFIRSYYEEILVVKVHPERLHLQSLLKDKKDDTIWKQRIESINDIERHLVRNGTSILKFFLHESLKEQKERLLARLNDPNKQWKFDPNDLDERERWNDYMKAYGEMMEATSTKEASWYILPADQKWLAQTLFAKIINRKLESMDLQLPQLSEEVIKELSDAKKRLMDE